MSSGFVLKTSFFSYLITGSFFYGIMSSASLGVPMCDEYRFDISLRFPWYSLLSILFFLSFRGSNPFDISFPFFKHFCLSFSFWRIFSNFCTLISLSFFFASLLKNPNLSQIALKFTTDWPFLWVFFYGICVPAREDLDDILSLR